MTRAEAAKFLGVSESFLGVDVVNKRHRIPYYHIGLGCVFTMRMLREWMSRRVINSHSKKSRFRKTPARKSKSRRRG